MTTESDIIEILRQLKDHQRQLDLLSSRDVSGSRGWFRSPYAWTRNSNTQFQIATVNDTARYLVGVRLWWKEGGVSKFGSVVASAFGANTTVDFVGDVMAATPDARECYYSYSSVPQGIKNNWGVLLYDSVLGAAAPSFDVQNIPSTFRHLRGELSARGDNASATIQLRLKLNNDGGNNYDYQGFVSYGGASVTGANGFAQAQAIIGWDVPAGTSVANHFGNYTIKVLDYASVSHYRGGHCIGGQVNGNPINASVAAFGYFGWRNAANAVNRLTVYPFAGNFIAGSRFTLYGE